MFLEIESTLALQLPGIVVGIWYEELLFRIHCILLVFSYSRITYREAIYCNDCRLEGASFESWSFSRCQWIELKVLLGSKNSKTLFWHRLKAVTSESRRDCDGVY